MKFRKKPVLINAFQWLGTPDQQEDPVWIIEKMQSGDIWIEYIQVGGVIEDVKMKIRTLEGVMTAILGDYIIQGVNGEIYPCKPDIFEKTYEIVEEK